MYVILGLPWIVLNNSKSGPNDWLLFGGFQSVLCAIPGFFALVIVSYVVYYVTGEDLFPLIRDFSK